MRNTQPATIDHAPVTATQSGRLLDAFYSGKATRTIEAYRTDLARFTDNLAADTPEAAAHMLIENGNGAANSLALDYRAAMLDEGLSPATINRRLSALRSVVKLARTIGLVAWSLDVPNVKAKTYRDTSGPGASGVRLLLSSVAADSTAKGARNRALIHLLYDLGLRRAEVVALDVEHLDVEAATLSIVGKGRRERETVTVPPSTLAALLLWIGSRDAGPMFTTFSRAARNERLTGNGLYRIIRSIGQAAGIKARPHGLRHAAITEALDVTGGNVRAVQRFSRHADVRTLALYDDNRTDMAGEVAAMVAGGVAL